MINLINVTKKFKDTVIFNDLNLEFSTGVNLLQGANGTGKSTLLKMIVGLDKNHDGFIKFDRSNHLLHLSYVPDEPQFFNKVIVEDFIKAISKLKRISTNEVQSHINFWNIQEIIQKEIGMLSLGQIKRLFLCIAQGSLIQYYILDEPFNGLDEMYTEKLNQFINIISKNSSVILTCHNESLLNDLVTRRFFISNHRIIEK